MRYLWGQGRVWKGVPGEGWGGWSRGVDVVGAGETWAVMSWRTVAGVTLSMKVKAGRRRMVVGRCFGGEGSWEGRGRSEAESMSFCDAGWWSAGLSGGCWRNGGAYSVAGLDLAIPDRFHHTSLLVTHVLNPIRLSGRYKHVRGESIHAAV